MELTEKRHEGIIPSSLPPIYGIGCVDHLVDLFTEYYYKVEPLNNLRFIQREILQLLKDPAYYNFCIETNSPPRRWPDKLVEIRYDIFI